MAKTTLLKSITLSNRNPMVGESIKVDIETSDPTVQVVVNGVQTSSSYIQFGSDGSHFISITATKDKVIEQTDRKVSVKATEADKQAIPIIWSVEDRYQPRIVALSVANAQTSLSQVKQFHWDFGDGTTGTSQDGLIRHDYTDSLVRDDLYTPFHVTVWATHADGTRTTATRTMSMFNLYGYNKNVNNVLCPRVNADQNPRMIATEFVCSMTLRNLEDEELSILDEKHEWLTTLEEPDPYQNGKSTTLFNNTKASSRTSLTATKATTTSHAMSMAVVGVNTSEILRIPARSTVTVARRFPQAAFKKETFGVAVHLYGIGMCSGQPVAASGYFEVKLPLEYGGYVIDPSALVYLNASTSQSASRAALSHDQLTEVVRHGDIARKAYGAMPASTPPMEAVMRDLPYAKTPAFVFENKAGASSQFTGRSLLEQSLVGRTSNLNGLLGPKFTPYDIAKLTYGSECDPDNTPDELPEGAVCQLTGELAWRYVPGRILNAKKGDVLLSPGGQGMIGQLLRRVSPPQFYSHSGIMTKNHIEVRHSTGSEDWLKDHPAGSFAGNKGVDGFEPAALKYLWPGTITQTIDHAYYGETMNSPEGNQYKIGTFSFDPDRGSTNTLAYPLVVKPGPFDETAAVRATLHRIADEALAIKGHYRFYGYTKPEIALDPGYVAGADSGWAVGTLPTVCSSFIWLAAQHAGVKLEGAAAIETVNELEIGDVSPGGAEVGPDTRDGLYKYRADERQAAAGWLYQTIYDEAHDKAGFWGTLFTDAPDNVANQICNVFASDFADDASENSDDWKNTGDANAVSPDNIMFWDSPAFGNRQGFRSVYGHQEEIFYKPGTYEQVPIYRWKHVETRGNLTGRVAANGSVEGASVSLLGSGQPDVVVHEDGLFHFDNVPAGNYTLEGGLAIDGYWNSADVPVNIEAGKTLDVLLTLQGQPGLNRLVNFTVHMDTTNKALADTDTDSFDMAGSLRVGPYKTHDGIGFDGSGDNPHGHIGFDVVFNADLSVTVGWTAQEVSDEVEGQVQHSATILQDQWLIWSGLTVNNDDPIDADWTVMSFTIQNAQAPV